MKNLNLSKRIGLIILAVFASANIALAVKPSASIINIVKADIVQSEYLLPIETMPGLVWTKMWYIPSTYTIAYKYIYDSYIEKPSNSRISEMKKSIIHMLKANPDSKDMFLLQNGITFHYNYYQPDGTFIFAVKITPADVK